MQQSMTQDPTAAMQQMRDMGMIVSFGQDQEKNGKKYWVLKATVNGNILDSEYFKNITQQMPVMPEGMDLQQMLDNFNVDLFYDMWIDQETFYADYMNMTGDIRYAINMPATEDTTAGPMEMTMAIQASYTMSDYGKEFTVPEVTGARDLEEVLADQAAQIQEALEAQDIE